MCNNYWVHSSFTIVIILVEKEKLLYSKENNSDN